jgi:hypothetical protein
VIITYILCPIFFGFFHIGKEIIFKIKLKGGGTSVMGKDSKTILYRRHEMLQYLISVYSTNYQSLKQEFDVTDKVIASDLNYIRDVLGVPLETHTGPYGYVRISTEWRKRKVYLNVEEQELLVMSFVSEKDEKRKKIFLGILIKACSPERYQHLL